MVLTHLHTRTTLIHSHAYFHIHVFVFTQLHRYTHTFTLTPALTLTDTNTLTSRFLCFRLGFLIISKRKQSCHMSGERKNKDEDEAKKLENLPDLQRLASQVLGRTWNSQVRHLQPECPRCFSGRQSAHHRFRIYVTK